MFPVQIENVITKHQSIREAAVIAVPHDRLGEVVGVWIDRNVDEKPITGAEIRHWVATQMNPQVWHFTRQIRVVQLTPSGERTSLGVVFR